MPWTARLISSPRFDDLRSSIHNCFPIHLDKDKQEPNKTPGLRLSNNSTASTSATKRSHVIAEERGDHTNNGVAEAAEVQDVGTLGRLLRGVAKIAMSVVKEKFVARNEGGCLSGCATNPYAVQK